MLVAMLTPVMAGGRGRVLVLVVCVDRRLGDAGHPAMRTERHGHRGDCLQRQPQHQQTDDESSSPTHMIRIAVASFTGNAGGPVAPAADPVTIRGGATCASSRS